MEPVTAWVTLTVVGVAMIALGVFLTRQWNRENRRRYPDRVSSRRFEINRKPRERK